MRVSEQANELVLGGVIRPGISIARAVQRREDARRIRPPVRGRLDRELRNARAAVED